MIKKDIQNQALDSTGALMCAHPYINTHTCTCTIFIKDLEHILFVFDIFILCVEVFAGMYAHAPCVLSWRPQKPGEGVRSPGARVTDGWKILDGSRNLPWIFWKTAESSLGTLNIFLTTKFLKSRLSYKSPDFPKPSLVPSSHSPSVSSCANRSRRQQNICHSLNNNGSSWEGSHPKLNE